MTRHLTVKRFLIAQLWATGFFTPFQGSTSFCRHDTCKTVSWKQMRGTIFDVRYFDTLVLKLSLCCLLYLWPAILRMTRKRAFCWHNQRAKSRLCFQVLGSTTPCLPLIWWFNLSRHCFNLHWTHRWVEVKHRHVDGIMHRSLENVTSKPKEEASFRTSVPKHLPVHVYLT